MSRLDAAGLLRTGARPPSSGHESSAGHAQALLIGAGQERPVQPLLGVLEDDLEAVIGYPTLAECYTTAALDGMTRLGL